MSTICRCCYSSSEFEDFIKNTSLKFWKIEVDLISVKSVEVDLKRKINGKLYDRNGQVLESEDIQVFRIYIK